MARFREFLNVSKARSREFVCGIQERLGDLLFDTPLLKSSLSLQNFTQLFFNNFLFKLPITLDCATCRIAKNMSMVV